MTRAARKLIRVRARARLRDVASRAVLVLAALMLLLTVARAGTRFFYCPMTQLTFDEPPCAMAAGPSSATDADAPAIDISDCCQEKWRAAAPTASTPDVGSPRVARAAVAAVLPSLQVELARAPVRPPFALAEAVRAGPPPPDAGERRARLMVFHI